MFTFSPYNFEYGNFARSIGIVSFLALIANLIAILAIASKPQNGVNQIAHQFLIGILMMSDEVFR